LHEVKEAKSLGGLGTTGLKDLIDGKEVTGINPGSYGNFVYDPYSFLRVIIYD